MGSVRIQDGRTSALSCPITHNFQNFEHESDNVEKSALKMPEQKNAQGYFYLSNYVFIFDLSGCLNYRWYLRTVI